MLETCTEKNIFYEPMSAIYRKKEQDLFQLTGSQYLFLAYLFIDIEI